MAGPVGATWHSIGATILSCSSYCKGCDQLHLRCYLYLVNLEIIFPTMKVYLQPGLFIPFQKVIPKLNFRRMTRVPAEKLFNNLRFPKTTIYYLSFPKILGSCKIHLSRKLKRAFSPNPDERIAWQWQMKFSKLK